MSTPNVGIPYVPEGTLDPAAGLNLALNIIDALLQTRVLSMSLTAPPASPVDGALYIVAGTGGVATGAWALQELNLARFVDEGDLWQFYEAGSQAHLVLNIADGGFYKFIPGSPGGWTLAAGLSDGPNDGLLYARRSGLWDEVVPLTISDALSPATAEDDVTEIIFTGSAEVAALSPGVVEVHVPSSASSSSTLLTATDESATLPNARRLIAGPGIAFNDATPGQRTVTSIGALPNKQWLNIDAAAPQAVGCSALVLLGSASTPAKAVGGTTIRGYWGKRRHTSTTSANDVASFRSANAQDECYFGVGGSTPTRAAGFYFRIRFGLSAIVAGERFFCGMALNAAEAGTVNPSALLNCLGVAKDGADTNLFFIHNDGSGAATKIDLGFAFIDRAFELILSVPLGGGSCDYVLTNLDSGVAYTGTVSTDLPANDIALQWRLWSSVGTTAGTAVAVDFHQADLRYPL